MYFLKDLYFSVLKCAKKFVFLCVLKSQWSSSILADYSSFIPVKGSQLLYSGTSDISNLKNFQPSSNFSVCRVTIFEVWEIPLKILGLLQFPIPGHSADLNSRKRLSEKKLVGNFSLKQTKDGKERRN